MPDPFQFTDLRFPSDGSVLNGFSIDIGANERVALYGPNGAGKTSVLRMIAGTTPGSERNAGVAYMPQSPYLFRGSVRFNLLLGRQGRATDALAIVDALGIGDLLDKPSGQLSGGEQQRVAIARTLAGAEPLVVLDEPFASVDAVDRSHVMAVIRERTAGRALLCVTHSLDDAAALCETLAIVESGELLQIGPVGEVLGLPANDRVAVLTGVSNVIHGTVTARHGDTVTLQTDSFDLTVVADAPVGSGLLVKVGAETVTVYSSRPNEASPRNLIECTVKSIRQVGALMEIAADGHPMLTALVTPGAMDALEVVEGGTVWFGIKAAAIDVVRTT